MENQDEQMRQLAYCHLPVGIMTQPGNALVSKGMPLGLTLQQSHGVIGGTGIAHFVDEWCSA